MFGKYVVREKLGDNGRSAIWLAEAPDGAGVVVKQLRAWKPGRDYYERFVREIRFHLANPHPGVLPVLDTHMPEQPSSDDRPWFVMPRVAIVRDALGERPALERVVEAVTAYGRTLAELAAGGHHHRDIKPANLFERDGVWLVGDFGLVTEPEGSELTTDARAFGPAHFMAPEMVSHAGTAVPEPADVWALAKTFWALATASDYPPPGPLRPDEPVTRLRAHVQHQRAYLLEPILDSATRMEPTGRPTMSQLAQELQAWLEPAVPETPEARASGAAARLRALGEPARRQTDTREEQSREAGLLYRRYRDDGLHRLYTRLSDVGLVSEGDASLLMLDFGGQLPRNDAVEQISESLSVTPAGHYETSLTFGVGYRLDGDGTVELIAGAFTLRSGENPTKLWRDSPRVRLGTQAAETAADDLARRFETTYGEALDALADLAERASADRMVDRQPALEEAGESVTFRTDTTRVGVVIVTPTNGEPPAYAVAWPDAPLEEIEADGDRLRVRSDHRVGWIERNLRGGWTLGGVTHRAAEIAEAQERRAQLQHELATRPLLRLRRERAPGAHGSGQGWETTFYIYNDGGVPATSVRFSVNDGTRDIGFAGPLRVAAREEYTLVVGLPREVIDHSSGRLVDGLTISVLDEETGIGDSFRSDEA
jgi:hypothetical protein